MGGVSVAGFRPGFGRGGITHSLVVMMGGFGTRAAGASAAISDAFTDLVTRAGAGAIAAGDGVDSAGEAIVCDVNRILQYL